MGSDVRMATDCNRPSLPDATCSNFLAAAVLCDSCHADFPDRHVDPYRTEPSVEDRTALAVMESSARKLNGRFQVAMPWKDKTLPFPLSLIHI